MRTSLASIRTAVAVGSVAYAFTAVSALGVTVFDNTPSQVALYLPSPGVEYGDEYRLSVPGLTLDSFAIQYYNGNTAPGTIRVWVRANDGGVDSNNAANPSPAPGTTLYVDTEATSVNGSGIGNFGRSSLAQFGIGLGDRVTITALFTVQDRTLAGLMLSNNPEAVGWSPNDYWQHTGAGTFGAPFGTYGGPLAQGNLLDVTAKIGAVPEPSTWLSLGGILAMAGFGAYRRFRK
ncbi:MAG: PEP-CTERM sorting domain-containing protein [Limisphaerales bacterium]